MAFKLLHGKEITRDMRLDIQIQAATLRKTGWVPRLASLEIGQNPAAALYIRNQERVATNLGIEFENRKFPQSITQREMLAAIYALNVDPHITGIILQRPVPEQLDLKRLQLAVAPSKDVEGMNPTNIGKVVYDAFILGPCTSQASVLMLKATGLEMQGLEVVIVGHSEIVGKPIALHLLAQLATVTVCHHGTRNLLNHTRRADALFVAVGKPGLITGDMIKPGAAVIDIGINQVEVTDEDGILRTKTVGDVDFESALEVAGWITPVPRGVGPATLSYLMKNVVAATAIQKEVYEEAIANR
jgi:methylenetetrahydrofolate dehydrogenase (NADP+)/methenyltetrahydrofolate cyclohydrolase